MVIKRCREAFPLHLSLDFHKFRIALPSATTSGSVLKIEGVNRTVPPSIVPIARCASGVSCSIVRRQKPFVYKKDAENHLSCIFP